LEQQHSETARGRERLSELIVASDDMVIAE
jgi:hypothetical protein